MTTFALVGAGPGLGLATGRRFGAAGHTVALIARDAEKLDGLTAVLARDDIQARGYSQFADYLDSIPGVYFQDTGPGTSNLHIRGATDAGFGSRRPAVASSSRCSTVSVASFLFVPITPVGPRLIQPAQ